MTNVQTSTEKPVRKPSFYGPGKFRWAVYPDFWPERWGRKPLLGFVFADDDFHATREAYNRGLLIQNRTFEPEVVCVGEARFKPRNNRRNDSN